MLAEPYIYCAGTTPALKFARMNLATQGFRISSSPQWNVEHLLLDVPSFRPGQWENNKFDTLLSSLPANITVWGGNLHHPALKGYTTVDLLQDEQYLLANARITAACTIPIIQSCLQHAWSDTSVLIIGWGRISRHLAPLLHQNGCPVTIATSTPDHIDRIRDAGCKVLDVHVEKPLPEAFRMIINTAPAQVLPEQSLNYPCIKIDLASVKGLPGEDVIWARGLPGIHAPEASGALIANSFLRIFKEGFQ